MTVISYEILVLAILGGSGIASALLIGLRSPFLIAGSAIGFASILRLVSTLFTWFLGTPSLFLEAWALLSVLVTTIGLSCCWRHWRPAAQAAGIFGAIGALSFLMKFWFQLGEMQHSDSTGIISRALLVIQSGATDWSPITSSPKRGLLYPIMLALGPDERILVVYTPVVFFSTALLVGWASLKISSRTTPYARVIALATIGGVLATIPMVRIAVTYLNSHTLVSYGITLMVVSALRSYKEQYFRSPNVWMFGLGGVVATVSRIEAILLVGIIAVSLVGFIDFARRDRARLGVALSVIGSSLLIWLWGLEVPETESFGLPYWKLAAVGLVAIVGFYYLSSSNAKAYLPHVVGVALGVMLIVEISQSPSPASLISAQWPNFALGAGGWATAVPVAIGLTLALGWRYQTLEYRWLMTNALLMTLALLVSKTFDGGFGREGFYDSVNRMALHVLPLFAIALIIGVGTTFDRLVIFLSNQRPREVRNVN